MGDDERAEGPAWFRRRATVVALSCAVIGLLVVGGLLAVRQLTAADSASAASASRATASASPSHTPSRPGSGDRRTASTAGPRVSSKAVKDVRTPRRTTARQRAASRVAAGRLDAFLQVSYGSLHRPAAAAPDVDALSTGAARGEIEALQAQYHDMGYRVVGLPRVTSVTLRSIDLSSRPARALLAVCLDSSHVDVVDKAGRSQKKHMYSSKAPVLNLYQLRLSGSRWVVATHAIPAKSTCSASAHPRKTQ